VNSASAKQEIPSIKNISFYRDHLHFSLLSKLDERPSLITCISLQELLTDRLRTVFMVE